MFKCSNVPMFQIFKYSNNKFFRCSNVQMFKCSNDQMFKCSNVQNFKCSKLQMLKCSNVQMFKCSNVQMSNVNKVELLSEHTSEILQSFLSFTVCFLTSILHKHRRGEDICPTKLLCQVRALGCREDEKLLSVGYLLRPLCVLATRLLPAPADLWRRPRDV